MPLLPMLGNGVGTKGAGGPGILQMFGSVAAAMPLLPLVTGVFGGLTATDGILQPSPAARTTAPRSPDHEDPTTSAVGPLAYPRAQARVARMHDNAPVAAPRSPTRPAAVR